MARSVPKMTTDEEAEAFLAQDLSDLDFSQFKRTRLKFRRRAAYLAPGTPAPRSGFYRAVGLDGDEVGDPITVARGEILPTAQAGQSWALVKAVHEAAEE
jgi:hypothetical protein